jgi:hypothetical protein
VGGCTLATVTGVLRSHLARINAMRSAAWYFSAFVAVVLPTGLHAQAGAAQPADAHSISWLQGCWTGEAFGGEVTECWMVASQDLLVGSFMLVQEGELQFTEHLVIGEADGTRGYHVKHFSPDLVGWEGQDEMVTFPFVRRSENRVEWGGLVYEYDGNREITVYLDMRGRDGSVETMVFSMTRVEGGRP